MNYESEFAPFLKPKPKPKPNRCVTISKRCASVFKTMTRTVYNWTLPIVYAYLGVNKDDSLKYKPFKIPPMDTIKTRRFTSLYVDAPFSEM